LRCAVLPVIAGVLILAACGNTGGLGAPEPGVTRNTPPTADARGEGVDGLLVGHRLMAAGEYELALKPYLRAASEQGINADVLSALGSANLHLGRLGQAEQILRRALELDPTFVPAMNNLGVVLMERGRGATGVPTGLCAGQWPNRLHSRKSASGYRANGIRSIF
jgi:tetratricopeptide (TPR) repeat protein